MTEPPPAPSESTDPSARGLLPTALISRDLQQRLIFYGLWGALMLGILVVFREVLLPFFLAVVVAYVMSPLVDWLQRWMARWVAVVTIYALLVGTMVTFTVLGVPRLAAEIEKLAKDAPSALAELRDEWLPAIERRMRDSMGQAPTAALHDPVGDLPHHAPRAKRIVVLFMAGAPSQMDLLDDKPMLRKFDGDFALEEMLKG